MTLSPSAGITLPLLAAPREIWVRRTAVRPINQDYQAGEYLDIAGPVDPMVFDAALPQVTGEVKALRICALGTLCYAILKLTRSIVSTTG